jgi:H+-transporting ATPase
MSSKGELQPMSPPCTDMSCSTKENQFIKFLSYFKGPILYVMELAVVLAAGLRDWIDFGVIIGILIMNAAVGWYQEK